MKEYAPKEKRHAQLKGKQEETDTSEGLSYMPAALQLSSDLPDHPLAPRPKTAEEQQSKPFQINKAHLSKSTKQSHRPFDFSKYGKAQSAQRKVEPFSFKKQYGDYEKPAQKKVTPFSFKEQYGAYEKPVQKQVEPFDFKPYQMKKEPAAPVEPYRFKPSSTQMPEAVQAKMENSLGQDFSNVNIHKDSQQATDVGALAFAQGNDVHFAPGQFKPDTKSGQELIGHELTHVVQQREGRVKETTQAKGLPVNDDPALEKEADELGKKAADGADGPPADSNPPAPSSGNGNIQRKCTHCEAKKKHNSHSAGHHSSDAKLSGGDDCPTCGTDLIQEKSAQCADKDSTTKHKAYLGRGPPAIQRTRRNKQETTVKHPRQAKADVFGNSNLMQLKSNSFEGGTATYLPNTRTHSTTLRAGQPMPTSNEGARKGGAVSQQKSRKKARDDCATCQRKPIQRTAAPMQFLGWDDVGNALGTAWDHTGGAVVDAVTEGAEAIVRRLAPNLYNIISDPIGTLRESVESGLGGWVSGIFGLGGIGESITNFTSQIGEVFTFFQNASEGNPKECAAFSAIIDSIRSFVDSVKESPVVEALGATINGIKGVFQKVTDLVIAPAFNAISGILGEAFNDITSIASDIWEWGAPVRNFLGSAWNWVLEQLGIAAEGAGGIMSWVTEQMDAIWTDIKSTFAPIIGPIQTVGTALVALSPVGPILAAIEYGPQLIEVITWLWNNKDNPDIIKASHQEMGHTILPQILEGGSNFSTTIESGINSFVEQVTAIGTGITSFIESITGIPIISLGSSAVNTISEHIQSLVSWATDQLKAAAEWVKSTFNKVMEAIEPYKEIICSVAMAIINPGMIPLILAGWAWRAIPDCFKPPIIDLLLDIIIDFLRAAPDLPFFGPLWSLLKSGVIGFCEGMRAQSDEVKIEVSNKIAKIISGASLEFIFGFVKGFLKGVWEGLTDPFKMIYQLVTGIPKLINWFRGTGSTAPESPTTTENTASNTNAAPAENVEGIQGRMREMGGELDPEVAAVSTNFMPAVQEQFQGSGGGFTFERLTSMLGGMWSAAQAAMQGAGQSMANSLCEFMMQGEAEGKLGESVGWLAGTIVFEVVLALLTAGVANAASAGAKVLKAVLRVLDWTGEALGAAFRALKSFGGIILDIVKKLGNLVADAGGAALRAIKEALGSIGRKLVNFGEELLGRLSRVGDGAGPRAANNATEEVTEEVAEEVAEQAVEEVVEEVIEETAEQVSEEVAEEIAEEATEQVAEEVAEEVTEELAEETAEQVAEEVTEEVGERAVDIFSNADKPKLIGRFERGGTLEIISKRKRLFGGNIIELNAGRTTTITGTLDKVRVVRERGAVLEGLTEMGENVGGINTLFSPKWGEIKEKHLDILEEGDEQLYWKMVTDEFWEVANRPWFEEAISRGDNFRFVSDPSDEFAIFVTNPKTNDFVLDASGNRIKSIFGREVDYLKANGYEVLDNGIAIKP